MEAHYTFIGNLIHDPEMQKFVSGVALAGVILLLASRLPKLFGTEDGIKSNIVPSKGFSITGLFDFFIEKFINYHDSIVGKENRQYVSFSGSIFLFILFSNLLGLVPGMAAITTTVWINIGIALVVFIYFNYLGIKNQGARGYLRHMTGPFALYWGIGILLFAIEALSFSLRILTLNLRLYWNITADHAVLGAFTELVPWGLPAGVYFLGLFVSFMQAFIFTTLTMVYILLAVQHEEAH